MSTELGARADRKHLFRVRGQGSGCHLGQQAALGLQVQLHLVALVVQEILQLQEFEGAQAPLVPPEHGQLQLTSLEAGRMGESHHGVSPPISTLPAPPARLTLSSSRMKL